MSAWVVWWVSDGEQAGSVWPSLEAAVERIGQVAADRGWTVATSGVSAWSEDGSEGVEIRRAEVGPRPGDITI